MHGVTDQSTPGALMLAERLRREVVAETNNGERLHALLVLLVAEQTRQTQLLREILAALKARKE
jgi:hypothetical protein